MKKARAARLAARLHLQPTLRGIAVLIITSTSIQLTTLPLMAMYFNRAAPVGILLNVAAGLLTGALMLLGAAGIAAGSLSSWLAAKLVLLAEITHFLLVKSVVPFAKTPFATFRVAHYEGPHSLIYALYFVPLAMIAFAIDRWRPVERFLPGGRPGSRNHGSRGIKLSTSTVGLVIQPVRFRVSAAVCLSSFVIAAAAVLHPLPDKPNGKLTIYFLDVGQGDSALVVFPKGSTMLVDGGGEIRFKEPEANPAATETEFADRGFSVGDAVVSRFIWALGRTRVDYVLATHADADHMDGASKVLTNFTVGQAIVGHVPENDPEFSRFKHSTERAGVPIASISAGERFELDGVAIEVLSPKRPDRAPVTSANNDSIVLRLIYGSVTLLLTGDIEQQAEAELISSGVDLRADVLKVPHHGSKTSSTALFVDAVHPRIAVISVGEHSRFSHPHPTVVNRYRERGVRLFQTGRDGTVTIETDGHSLEVRTFRKNNMDS
jgi:competence protein ComEC